MNDEFEGCVIKRVTVVSSMDLNLYQFCNILSFHFISLSKEFICCRVRFLLKYTSLNSFRFAINVTNELVASTALSLPD